MCSTCVQLPLPSLCVYISLCASLCPCWSVVWMPVVMSCCDLLCFVYPLSPELPSSASPRVSLQWFPPCAFVFSVLTFEIPALVVVFFVQDIHLLKGQFLFKLWILGPSALTFLTQRQNNLRVMYNTSLRMTWQQNYSMCEGSRDREVHLIGVGSSNALAVRFHLNSLKISSFVLGRNLTVSVE